MYGAIKAAVGRLEKPASEGHLNIQSGDQDHTRVSNLQQQHIPDYFLFKAFHVFIGAVCAHTKQLKIR